MSFSVRRVEDPAIYVRRKKHNILGIGNAWDNIEDFKDALNKLEHNIDAVDKPTHHKPGKKTNSMTGTVLKEISSETQHLGKVTRFQLLGGNHSYEGLPKHSVPSVEIKTRCNDVDKAITISDISSINRETYSKSSQGVPIRNGYSPSRYSVNGPKNERSSFFTTTTVNPVILNETSSDSNRNKESSFSNTTVNSSSNNFQQFSLSTAPSFHGKAVLAKNEAGLHKIKEKVQKQKAMLSKQDEEITNNVSGDRKLHDNREKVAMSNEPPVEKKEMIPIHLKRKVGAILSSGPSYRGFNPVSSQKSKKDEKGKSKLQHNFNKTSKESNSKGPARTLTKQEPKLKKAPGKMTRIISSKCPKEVISTTSWREGQATVKKILSTKKVKPFSVPSSAPAKSNTTYNLTSPTQDELSEGRLSSDENEKFEMVKPRAKKMEAEKDIIEEVGIDSDSDVDNEERLKDVLSNEAHSMLAELAQDSSESESELNEEQPKISGVPSKKTSKGKRPNTMLKPMNEEKYPNEKSRHYDQTEVQRYMAQQIAERKKKLKQEKIQKIKQEEDRQKRLKDLYERQKKTFAIAKKEKHLGQSFSDNGALYIPEHDRYPTECKPGQSESDKENTAVGDVKESSNATSFDEYSEDEILNSEEEEEEATQPQLLSGINQFTKQVIEAAPLDTRAQRLSALQATALALQSRLHSQALRLGGVNDTPPQATRVALVREGKNTEFQGILPGVTNIRKRADENEKQMARVQAATKIQAAYRGHNVRKRSQWKDDESDVISLVFISEHSDDSDMVIVDNDKHTFDGVQDDQIEYPPISSSYNIDQSNNGIQLSDLRYEECHFKRATDIPLLPSTHFTIPSIPFEPRGDRFSVMNVFTRRHTAVAIEEILDEQPGSETVSLLDVGEKTDPKEGYEDDFTDEDISTTSALTEGDLKKESPAACKEATYSECFDSEDEQHEKDSTMRDIQKESSDTIQQHSPQSPTMDDVFISEGDNAAIIPIMTSTIQTEQHNSSPSLSDASEPVAKPMFVKPPVQRAGYRFSPESLQRKLTAEINLLENVEDSVRQVNDIEKTRAVSLAQQETVSLAQILKAKQHNHEQEMQNLRLKAKEEAIQAAKDLEKTRQAAALAAASASETLAQVHSEVLKTNAENSKKYVEEASKMASCVLTDTTKQLAEFCKNVTATTSAAVQQLHKMDRPTTTLIERATSYSEGHTAHSGTESISEEHTRTSDVYSNQSKSWETSPSVTSGHQHEGYSSDDFESDKSRINDKEESKSKMEHKHTSASLSVESITEDFPDEPATDDDTTINEESANDSQSLSTGKQTRPEKGHGAVSPVSLEYSSHFDDSSRAPTDDDIDFRILLPSRRSLKRINRDSFDEEKGKGRNLRTPNESDDSFGKFTVDIIQQYMAEEEVRTKHQTAILRLREKSLKEKTKAELRWLEQLKKRSRNKGSDDVMPSIKKRERGILMKLKAEKEEIKCLKAVNRAASFQRRFMVYQQQEITRLHQATLNIRKKIEGDVSKRSSQTSLHELSSAQPKTSSPIKGTNSSVQTSPSNSLSDVKKSSKTSFVKSSSPSAKSVSEDISEEQGTFHVSPAAASSPFPSYSTSLSEPPSESAQHTQPPKETTNTFDKSFVGSGEPEMLVERQPKSEVNNVLQRVTEIINNQKNVVTHGSHGNDTATESAGTPPTISEVKETKKTNNSLSHSELSIPEDLASTGKTISEEMKDISKKTPSEELRDISGKTASEYTNCTFESDDTTPSRPTTVSQDSSHVTEARVQDEHPSLTETSEHSDYEDTIQKLKHEIQKMKADALEKSSAMEIKVLTLEIELKSARKDIQRMMEIKTVSALPVPVATLPVPLTSSSTTKKWPQISDHSVKDSVKEAEEMSVSKQKKFSESSDHEVEESFIEIRNDTPTSLIDRTKSGSLSLDRSEESDIPEEISEHQESDTRSIASIPGETEIIEEQDLSSKALDVSQNTPQKSYTEPESTGRENDGSLAGASVEKDLDERSQDSDSFSISENLPEDNISNKSDVSAEKTLEIFQSLKDSENLADVPDPDEQSQILDSISKNLSEEVTDEDISAKSDALSAEKETEDYPELKDYEFPDLKDSEFPDSKDSEFPDLKDPEFPDLKDSEFSDSKDSEFPDLKDPEFPDLKDSEFPDLKDSEFPDLKDPEFQDLKDSEFPDLRDSELPSISKATEEIQNLRVTVPRVVDTSENATPIIPETSNKIIGKEDISEKSSVEQEQLEGVEDGEKSRSQISSIAEEIPSSHEDEDSNAGEKDGGYEWDSSENSTHTSAGNDDVTSAASKTATPSSPLGDYSEENGNKDVSESSQKLDAVNNESPTSESSKSEKVFDVEKERQDSASQEEEQYSEDFDDDDEETESDIPEMFEEEGEEESNEDVKNFAADDEKVTAKEETEDNLDDITDEIYWEIMDDSFDCKGGTKSEKKSRGKVEPKSSKTAEITKNGDKSLRASSVTTLGITNDLLSDAIFQMVGINRRKNKSPEGPTTSGKSPGYEIPPVTSPLGVGAGFDENNAVSNALVLAKSNQALHKDALRSMQHDIEGLLGMSLDDEEDECDFKVNENKFTDILSGDTEPSVHEYSPMFAVPHNLQEVTSIVNSTVDMLLTRKRQRMPLDNCKPTAQLLGGDTENEFEDRSTRSYRNLVFDLTKELFIDTVTQNEVALLPPWTKAKWKGGQKLSRNFSRCKSDDEVRALVLERVTDTIGLGAPRATIQTLQRKTPVRGNKKDNVDAILIEELREEEPQWTDYDEDEIAVKFQIADSILNMLLDDTARVFNAIEAKRNIPDNVLVI